MIPTFTVKRSAPMLNAERQQRWRDRHRPRKRAFKQWGPDGRLVNPMLPAGQFAAPVAAEPPQPFAASPNA